MMNDEIHIKWNRSLWILYPNEIIRSLPEDLKTKALRRGKGYRRSERVERFHKDRCKA